MSLTIKFAFLILYLGFQLAARAELPADRVWWDSSFYSNTRNFPLGFSVGTQWGLGVTAWNATKSSAVPSFFKDFAYGYLRTQGRVQTSGVVSLGDLRLEIYPVSILGFIAGKNTSTRSTEFSGIDCQNYLCRGSVNRDYLAATAVVGAGGLSLMGYLRRDQVSSASGALGFYDESSSLMANSSQDSLMNWDVVLAYRLPGSGAHRLGLIYSEYSFANSLQNSQSAYGFWAFSSGKFLWQVGAGQYESTIQARGFSAFAGIKWSPKKGASLL